MSSARYTWAAQIAREAASREARGEPFSLSVAYAPRVTELVRCVDLGALQHLTALDASWNDLHDGDVAALVRPLALRSIDLSHNHVRDDGARVLAACTTLQSIGLAYNSVTPAGLAVLCGMPHLTELDVTDCGMSDACAEILSRSSSLRSLALGRHVGCCVAHPGAAASTRSTSAVTDAGVTALAGCLSLTRLDLSSDAVTHVGLLALRACPTLEALKISCYSPHGDAAARALASYPRLRALDMQFAAIGPSGAAALAESTTLATLVLFGNSIGDAGATALARAPALTSLDVGRCIISDAGAVALCSSASLTALDISDNGCTLPPTHAVLQHNFTLERLENLPHRLRRAYSGRARELARGRALILHGRATPRCSIARACGMLPFWAFRAVARRARLREQPAH